MMFSNFEMISFYNIILRSEFHIYHTHVIFIMVIITTFNELNVLYLIANTKLLIIFNFSFFLFIYFPNNIYNKDNYKNFKTNICYTFFLSNNFH